MSWLTKEIKISYKNFLLLSLIFLSLPVMIFLGGMVKLYISIPLILAWMTFTFLAYREYSQDASFIKCKRFTPAFIFLVCLVAIVIFGVGEFMWSDDDHKVRYAILNDLINYRWPIIYDFNSQQNPAVKEFFGSGSAAFVYYYVFWMVPAVIGKLFGLMAARVALVIWSAIGLSLVFTGMGFISGKLQKRAFYLLIFFGGLDIVALMIKIQMGDPNALLELWNEPLIVHGNFAQLMNVFNQTIPCWLIGLFVFKNDFKKSLGFWGALMFCYSPWATIGLVPLALARLFCDEGLTKKFNIKNARYILSVNNILPEIIALIIMGSYYMASSGAMTEKEAMGNGDNSLAGIIISILLYIVVEFGVWMALLYKANKASIFYWVILLEMLVLPVVIPTRIYDFFWRGSLVPMWFIVLMLTKSISKLNLKKYRDLSRVSLLTILLIVVVSFGGWLQFLNITISTMSGTPDVSRSIVSFGNIVDENEAPLVRHNFYSDDYKDKFFFKYLAR